MTWDHPIDLGLIDNEESLRIREKMKQLSTTSLSLMEKTSPTKKTFVKGHRRAASADPRLLTKISTAQGTTQRDFSMKGN